MEIKTEIKEITEQSIKGNYTLNEATELIFALFDEQEKQIAELKEGIKTLINKYKISASTLLEVIQKTDNSHAPSSRRFVIQFLRELQSLK